MYFSEKVFVNSTNIYLQKLRRQCCLNQIRPAPPSLPRPNTDQRGDNEGEMKLNQEVDFYIKLRFLWSIFPVGGLEGRSKEAQPKGSFYKASSKFFETFLFQMDSLQAEVAKLNRQVYFSSKLKFLDIFSSRIPRHPAWMSQTLRKIQTGSRKSQTGSEKSQTGSGRSQTESRKSQTGLIHWFTFPHRHHAPVRGKI